ncbi:uncharacterized protein [Haliotis asinina]|uniref:uncharacterized protein n=1 Tax=Haliotis asinina TaxID=109174 RepID=UPI0035326C48
MRRNVSTDIRSLNIQLNQSISDQFHTNQTLAGLTQDFITLKTSCVVTEREIKSYREGLQEMRRNVSTDIRSLNIQLNQSISDQFHTNQTLAGLTQDFITLKTSCVVTEREIKSYREGLQEMRRNVSTDIQSLNIQLNQSISDQFDTNQTLAGLTQDFITLKTSCVVTEREIKSYREGLQEMRRNVSTDIRSLNIQLNQSISDQFHTNQTLAGLTQDFITLKTSCVVTEREIKSYREGLQEMRRNVSTDIRSLNIQLNQSISDQFHTNQTLAGLTQDFITLKTSCVVTEREIKSYREGLLELRRNVSTDIRSLNIQLNQSISDQFDTNQTLAGLTQDFITLNTSCVVTEREIKSYRDGLQEMRRNVSTDIQSLNIQLNQSISDQFHTNQTLAGLTQDFITLKSSCVVTEREIKSYREGLQEMRRNVSTDIRSLNIQLNQSISDQFHTNQTLAGLTQDFITLKTSCVVTEREIKSYREGLQEMRRNVSTDIQSLNIQLNQSISDQFDTNQTLAGLTQDFITLKTSCVVTEREIKSYREGLQEMRRNVSTDIRSLNIQLNQSISDQFHTNQTLAGLTQDFITLKTSCVVTEREIKSYREGLQEMRRNVSTDIRSLNIQLNQSISDQFHTNQTLAGLTQDFITLKTSCVVTEREIKSYREGLLELRRNVSTDIRSLNIQLNQSISDQFDTNQTLAGLTQDFITLNTSCVVTEREIKSYRDGLQEMRRNVSTDIQSLNIQLNQSISDQFDTNQTLAGLTQNFRTLNTSFLAMWKEIKELSTITYHGTTEAAADRSPSNTFPPAPVTTQDLQASTTDASENLTPSKTVPPSPVTTQDSDTHATPSPAASRDLYYASSRGDLETVKRILAQGDVDINYRGRYSRTPVMRAARRGRRDVVEFLVGRGADVSLVDRDGDNVLHWACIGGDLETVKLILSMNVVDINARNNYGKTAADYARDRRHQRVLDLLVSRGAH